MLTKGLFYEHRFNSENDIEPIYTLSEEDRAGCISMYKIYMECSTEYEAAMTLLGSWIHWKKLISTHWFMKVLSAWREEKAIRDAAIGRNAIIEKAKEGNISAAKELISQARAAETPFQPTKRQEALHKQKEMVKQQKVVSILERANSV